MDLNTILPKLYNNMYFMRLKRNCRDLLISMIINLNWNIRTATADPIWIRSRLYPYDKTNSIKKNLEDLIRAKFIKKLNENEIELTLEIGMNDYNFSSCNESATPASNQNKHACNPCENKNISRATPAPSVKIDTCNPCADEKDDFTHININNNINNTSSLDTESITSTRIDSDTKESNLIPSGDNNNIMCENENENAGATPAAENNKSLQDKIDEFEKDENIMKIYDTFVKYRNVASDKPDIPTNTHHKSQYCAWLSEIERLLRIDKYSVDEVCQLIKYMESQSFWYPNFQSISKLRRRDQDGVTYYNRFKALKEGKFIENKQKKSKKDEEEHKFPDGLRVI